MTLEKHPGQADEHMPWVELQACNIPLLQKLAEVYGTCAVVACVGNWVVGLLRFYPKAVCAMPQAGKRFWEKLGFLLVATGIEQALLQEDDFARAMREEAAVKGVDAASIANQYTLAWQCGQPEQDAPTAEKPQPITQPPG